MKNKNIILTALVAAAILALPSFVFAASFEQTQTGAARESLNLYGGYVEDFAQDFSGNIYVGLNSPNGIYASQDNGESWTGPQAGADLGNIGDVEVSSTSGVAFAIGGISLYKTTNFGSAWTEIAGSSGDLYANNFGSTMLFAHDTLFVPVRDGTLDISSNEGATFTNVAIGSDVTGVLDMTAVPTSDEVLALVQRAEDTAIYYSADNGSTWVLTPVIGDMDYVEVDQLNPGTIVISSDDGSIYTLDGFFGTWHALSTTEHGEIAFDSASGRIYLGGEWTDDYGTTWHNLQNEATHYDSILKGNHIMVPYNAPGSIFIASGQGVARSDDNGANWYDKVGGMSGVTVYDIAQSADKNTVWLAAQGGLAKTENYLNPSPTWQFPILPNISVDFANAVLVNQSDSNVVLAAAGSNIYKTIDGGTTWTQTTTPVAGIFTCLTSGATTLYAGSRTDAGGGSVYMSTDNGDSWTNFGTGIVDVPVNTMTVSANENLIFGVGKEFNSDVDKRGIYTYGDGWEHVMGENLVNDVLAVGDTVYAAVGETSSGSVYKSTDNGASWSEINNGLPTDGWFHTLATETANHNILYVSTARPAGTGHIYKSTDAGNNWFEYYTGLKDEAFTAMLFDGMISGTNTGLYEMKTIAKLAVRPAKYSVKATAKSKVKIAATLKDGSTGKVLANRTIKVYKRTATNKPWKYIGKIKTNKTGKASIRVKPLRTTYYQFRYKPTGSSIAAYGADTYAKAIRIKVKR